MFPELDEFMNITQHEFKRLEKFTEELSNKRSELAKEERRYRQMLEEEINGTGEHGVLELNSVQQHIKNLQTEIDIAEQRVQRLTRTVVQQGIPLLDNVYKGAERLYAEVNEQLLPLFEQARRHRAQMLLTLQKANQFYSQANAAFEAVQMAERSVGREPKSSIGVVTRSKALDIREWFRDTQKTRDTEYHIGMLPHPEECIKAAYDGVVPEWVEQYKQESE